MDNASDLNLFGLAGRVALISGGSKGLGKMMAKGLATAGADVVIASRNEADLLSAASDIEHGTGARVFHVVADLGRRSEAQRVAERARDLAGPIDILINNVGINLVQRVEEITDDAWDDVLELNVGAAMALTRAVAPDMCSRRHGRILNISSISPCRPLEGRGAYATAKAALLGLTRATAVDLGRYGVTVNSIAPGFFPTGLTELLLAETVKREYVERAALGRVGEAADLIGPVLLLVSDAGAFITGQTIAVDGGWLLC